jgi:hypothetical protein
MSLREKLPRGEDLRELTRFMQAERRWPGPWMEIQPMSATDIPDLDVRGKLAHIDQMRADHDRKRPEIRLAPWQMALGGMTAPHELAQFWRHR